MDGLEGIGPGLFLQATTDSLTRLLTPARNAREHLGPAITRSLEGQIPLIAEQVRKTAVAEYKAGHDKYGESHDKGGGSVDTFRVRTYPGGAVVESDWRTFLVNFGFVAHTVTGNPLLYFTAHDGNFVVTHQVQNPGYAGDDFAGRTIRKTVVPRGVELRILSDAEASIWLGERRG